MDASARGHGRADPLALHRGRAGRCEAGGLGSSSGSAWTCPVTLGPVPVLPDLCFLICKVGVIILSSSLGHSEKLEQVDCLTLLASCLAPRKCDLRGL